VRPIGNRLKNGGGGCIEPEVLSGEGALPRALHGPRARYVEGPAGPDHLGDAVVQARCAGGGGGGRQVLVAAQASPLFGAIDFPGSSPRRRLVEVEPAA